MLAHRNQELICINFNHQIIWTVSILCAVCAVAYMMNARLLAHTDNDWGCERLAENSSGHT